MYSSIFDHIRKTYYNGSHGNKKRDRSAKRVSWGSSQRTWEITMRTEYYYLGTSACKIIANSFTSSVSINDNSLNVKSFDEKICVAYQLGRNWKHEFYKPCELENGLKNLPLQRNRSYYITNQSLMGFSQSRKQENLFSFHNIVMDIDGHEFWKNHKNDIEFQEAIDKLIFCVKKDTCEITPNFIVKTSRGIQCWWNFEETSKVLAFAYQRAVNTLFRVLSDILKDNNLDDVFSVDRASKRKVGLFRLPGSFNHKTELFTEIEYIHDKKQVFTDFNEYINDWFGLHWNTDAAKTKKKAIIPITKSKKEFVPLMIKRTRLIECMIDKGFVKVGNREVSLFLFYNSSRQLPYFDLTPEEQTRQLNQRLKEPLKDCELEAIFRNKRVYKISNTLFYEYLKITEQEAREIYMTKSNFSRDFERLTKKQNRNKEIVRRFQIGKQSILGISKTMGISRNTVKTVLRDFGLLEPQK